MKTCGNKKVKNEKWMRKEWWNELERCDEKAWNKDAWNEEVKLLQVKVERRSLRQCKKATRLSQQTLGSVTTLQAKRRKAQQSRRYAGRQTITQMKTDRMKGRTKRSDRGAHIQTDSNDKGAKESADGWTRNLNQHRSVHSIGHSPSHSQLTIDRPLPWLRCLGDAKRKRIMQDIADNELRRWRLETNCFQNGIL